MIPEFKTFGFSSGIGFPTTRDTVGLWANYKIGASIPGETWKGALKKVAADLPPKVDICFSGKDSIIWAYLAKEAGKQINLWWLDIADDPNRTVVTEMAKSVGVPLNIVPLSMQRSIDQAVKQANLVFTNKPTYLLVPYLFDKMENYIIVGEGDPEKSADAYRPLNLVPGTLVVNWAEFSYDMSLQLAGKQGCGAINSATPELVRTAQKLTYLSNGDLTMVNAIKQAFPNLPIINKTDNWANRNDSNALIRKTISQVYPEINGAAKAQVQFS